MPVLSRKIGPGQSKAIENHRGRGYGSRAHPPSCLQQGIDLGVVSSGSRSDPFRRVGNLEHRAVVPIIPRAESREREGFWGRARKFQVNFIISPRNLEKKAPREMEKKKDKVIKLQDFAQNGSS